MTHLPKQNSTSPSLVIILKEIEQKIVRQLKQQQLSIAFVSHHVDYHEEQKLKELSRLKKKIEQQLQQVNKQQKLWSILAKKTKRKRIDLVKSKITFQEKQKLSYLKNKMQQFQLDLKKKTQAYKEKITNMRIQENKNTEIIVKQRSLTHKNQLMNKKKHYETQSVRKFQNNVAYQIPKTRLHVLWRKKQIQKQMEEKQKRLQYVLQQNQKNNINFKEIKTHQQKYLQTLKTIEKQREVKRNQINMITRQKQEKDKNNRQKTIYHKILQEQQQKIRQQKQRQNKEKMYALERLKNFLQRLDQNKSKIRKRKKSEQSVQGSQQKKSYSRDDIKQQGNTFLKEGNIRINKKRKEVSTASEQQISAKSNRDYLRQFRIQRQKIQKNTSVNEKYSTIINNIQKIKHTLNNSQTQIQKFKRIVKKMQNQISKKQTEEQLIKKIGIKLKILQTTN